LGSLESETVKYGHESRRAKFHEDSFRHSSIIKLIRGNLSGCNDRDFWSEPLRRAQLAYIHTKIYGNQFRHSNNIKVITE
jgi:hypothetical protein